MDQQSERSLITGGAGFIGTNLAYKLLAEGKAVRILDNFERNGVERNKIWLEENFGKRIFAVEHLLTHLPHGAGIEYTASGQAASGVVHGPNQLRNRTLKFHRDRRRKYAKFANSVHKFYRNIIILF